MRLYVGTRIAKHVYAGLGQHVDTHKWRYFIGFYLLFLPLIPWIFGKLLWPYLKP